MNENKNVNSKKKLIKNHLTINGYFLRKNFLKTSKKIEKCRCKCLKKIFVTLNFLLLS